MSSFADSRCPQDVTGPQPSLSSLLSLLQSVPVLLWQTDRDLCRTCVTGAALRHIDSSGSVHAGLPVDALFATPAAHREVRQAHEAALRGELSSFEIEVQGRVLHAMLKSPGVSVGPDIGVIGIAFDLTERTVAE